VAPAELFPVLLVVHVTLAVSLFLPSFLLPFTLRTRGRLGPPGSPSGTGRVTGTLLWLETHGTVIIGAGVAATGIALLVLMGGALLGQPWLLAALLIYTGVLLSAFFIQRPGLRRLLRLPDATGGADQELWRVRARRQRYVSYLMAAGIGLIGWLMMAKPGA
jgi:uncharacterized membrane protein